MSHSFGTCRNVEGVSAQNAITPTLSSPRMYYIRDAFVGYDGSTGPLQQGSGPPARRLSYKPTGFNFSQFLFSPATYTTWVYVAKSNRRPAFAHASSRPTVRESSARIATKPVNEMVVRAWASWSTLPVVSVAPSPGCFTEPRQRL